MGSKRVRKSKASARAVSGFTAWAPLIPIIAVFLAASVRYWTHTVDDAFISFRYAKNFVQGWGLVFNQGERVEGYTNFLWVILSCIPEYLGFSTETFAKVIGVGCGIGVIATISAPSNGLSRSVRWIPALFLAVSAPFVLWATSGLETPLFSLLVTVGVLRGAWGAERGEAGVAAALVLGFAALTRPEGALVAATVSSVLLILTVRRVLTWPAWLKWNLAFLAVFVPYFFWRYAYYGYLFPNTFYAKVNPGVSETLRGLKYLNSCLAVSGYWLLLLVVGLWWVKRPRFLAIVGTTLGAYAAYIVIVGGDGLPMYRFFVPFAGLFYLLFVGCGADGLWNRLHGRRFAISAGAIVLALALAWAARPFVVGADYEAVMKDTREVWTWKVIGSWFRQNAAPGASIAVIPAGALPYFSGLRALDMLGLNDLTIAHRPIASVGEGQAGHEKYDVACGDVESLPYSTIENNVRFPGQYFDQETGLHQNGFRDYSPKTGRYQEADPIGLSGDSNVYGYAAQRPTGFFDPDGLVALPVAAELVGEGIGLAESIGLSAFALDALAESYCPKSDNACDQILEQILKAMNEITIRIQELLGDERDLFINAYDTKRPDLPGTFIGHIKKIKERQLTLRRLLEIAERMKCPIPPGAWKLATGPIPTRPRKKD